MNEDQNFDLRNALNAERASLMSSLSANTSPIGGWKIAKIQEARMMGEQDPYDLVDLSTRRRAARIRINEIDIELAKLDGTEPTQEQLLSLAKGHKQNEITEHDNSANVNSFVIGGLPMWLSWEQRSRLISSINAIEADGGTEMTKSFAGIDYTFTTVQWRQMVNIVEAYAGRCQTVTEEHRQTVNALATVEEVEAYDFTTGYPDKVNFDEMLAAESE